MSPEAASLGARAVFWAFAVVIVGHLAFLGWAAPLGEPRVVLVLGILFVAIAGAALWLAWLCLVRHDERARFWGFALLTCYSVLLIGVAFFPDAVPGATGTNVPRNVAIYLALLWAGTLLGTALSRRAAEGEG